MDPALPALPLGPTTPVDPVPPTVPVFPVDPGSPGVPDAPGVPAGPEAPAVPTGPVEPDQAPADHASRHLILSRIILGISNNFQKIQFKTSFLTCAKDLQLPFAMKSSCITIFFIHHLKWCKIKVNTIKIENFNKMCNQFPTDKKPNAYKFREQFKKYEYFNAYGLQYFHYVILSNQFFNLNVFEL